MIELTYDPEIQSDGVTVWVHGPTGTIGRFGRNGIDVHAEDTASCLHCTHDVTTAQDWVTFQLKMLEHHGVVVGDEHKPVRF